MNRKPWRWVLSTLCALSLFIPAHQAAEPPAEKPEDITKKRAEGPIKRIVAAPAKSAKQDIESPVEALLATRAAAAATENPKVEPGKVQWHADFATACTASAKSGKPVLLFQMMGKLDDKFC